jgi:hypothetical protein
MMGICPNCKIKLKEPPFNGRETNEVVLTLKYRKFIENKSKLGTINDLGYCELCNASKDDLEGQK